MKEQRTRNTNPDTECGNAISTLSHSMRFQIGVIDLESPIEISVDLVFQVVMKMPSRSNVVCSV